MSEGGGGGGGKGGEAAEQILKEGEHVTIRSPSQ